MTAAKRAELRRKIEIKAEMRILMEKSPGLDGEHLARLWEVSLDPGNEARACAAEVAAESPDPFDGL